MIPNIVTNALGFFYGLFTLTVFTFYAALDGSLFRTITDAEKEALTAAQRKFWELSKSPFGLNHRFFALKDGRKLHYMEMLDKELEASKSLVVFIHGFPDCWILWHRLLAAPQVSRGAVLVAVDLGGYGGSDSLPDYTPDTVLESMASFIIGMRDRYDSDRVFVVSHDWGSVIAFRLASEAPQIANRFVISSAVLPEQVMSTAKGHLGSAMQMLHTWLQRPLSLRLLKTAVRTVSPLFSQARKSGYVVVFNLPHPLSNFAGRMGGRWFLRLMHTLSRRPGSLTPNEAVECMAASLGPGSAQLESASADDLAYPESLTRRLHDGGWSEKIRLYRENLFRGRWEKSLELIVRLSELDQSQRHSRRSSSGAGLFDDGPPGSLKAPVTVVYGKRDPAFEPRLALEGISDYLAKQSQVVVLEEGGHWLPVEKAGVDVLEQIIGWALEGEDEALKLTLGELVVIET